MLITVTNPDVLKQYPHLAPARLEMADTVVTGPGTSETTYTEKARDPRAGYGRLMLCSICGTYLRTGQPHSALKPTPHQSLDMLTAYEPEDFEERQERAAEKRLEDAQSRQHGARLYYRRIR